MKKINFAFSLMILLTMVACSGAGNTSEPRSSLMPLASSAPTVTKDSLAPTLAMSSSIPEVAKPVQTLAPPDETNVPLPTLTRLIKGWIKVGPGTILCPILLYHRIAFSASNDPYYVTPEEFRTQMEALKNWGYTAIPITTLVKAIKLGADLPERPVVITFDDGDETVYSTAYPILQELGFEGVIYLVVKYVGADGYMNVDQIKELAASGWEVGSHSLTHTDLTSSTNVEDEIVYSRLRLEQMLGLPVETFAYPFGKKTDNMYSTVMKNYQAGLGLGVSFAQRREDVTFLWRRPVYYGTDLQTFGSYLPWSAPPEP